MWANKAWVGRLFPPGSQQRDFLALYSRRFNTVEGNTTFYATPSAETVARWREETPPGFKFCLKFPQSISHRKRLRGAQAETEEFLERLEQLGDRCGPSFLQLPPTFGRNSLPVLLAYLDALPRRWAGYAVEVRHMDFFGGPAEGALDEGLRERGVARVLYDQRGLRSAAPATESIRTAQARKPNVPVRFALTAGFGFVRFIGHPDLDANGGLLDEWAERAADWLAAGHDVFFFCHHKDDANAPALARAFHGRLAARVPALPPLPAWEAGEPPEVRQGTLL
jgi:uncharacterized protein YecE (DUF72 family)